MLSKKKRLNRAVFSSKPLMRVNLGVATAALHSGPVGAAVVVSKKVAPSAVLRNKIRRRVYAALRTIVIHKATVVYPTKLVATIPYQELVTALAKLGDSRYTT